ncbi:uncharacterized protein A4U43_C03F26360 [Asparagus officinalis]|uniref:Uncharacterized protein n=1 Tax=Asparagus officinalis TaxID=4686 RepID=A0A5P1FIA6_ASPOF|nr:uncharacterized protein A4U43_C03F26360 [Asparagus officinalis]
MLISFDWWRWVYWPDGFLAPGVLSVALRLCLALLIALSRVGKSWSFEMLKDIPMNFTWPSWLKKLAWCPGTVGVVPYYARVGWWRRVGPRAIP